MASADHTERQELSPRPFPRTSRGRNRGCTRIRQSSNRTLWRIRSVELSSPSVQSVANRTPKIGNGVEDHSDTSHLARKPEATKQQREAFAAYNRREQGSGVNLAYGHQSVDENEYAVLMCLFAGKAAAVFLTSLLGAFVCLPASASPLFPHGECFPIPERTLPCGRSSSISGSRCQGVAPWPGRPLRLCRLSQASRKTMASTPHPSSTPIPLLTHGRSQSPVRYAYRGCRWSPMTACLSCVSMGVLPILPSQYSLLTENRHISLRWSAVTL